MDDLIRRQDALREIRHWLCYERSTKTPYEVLLELPSVSTEISRCETCEHRKSSLYCDAWNNSPGFPCIGDEMFCSMAERKDDEKKNI